MADHNIYIAELLRLGNVTYKGFNRFEVSTRKSMVYPGGDARVRDTSGVAVKIEETISAECEDLDLKPPEGPVSFQSQGIKGVVGDNYGGTGPARLACATKAAVAAASWLVTTAYTVGLRRKNGANVYVCTQAGTSAGSGGPNGTGNAIVDGTCLWDFVAVSANAYEAATVEVIDWNIGLGSDGNQRLMMTIKVYSQDKLTSGLAWTATA